MFGLGDQANYIDTHQDAMGILNLKLLERGATDGIGFTSTETHTFEESPGVIDGKFCGLALDEDNQNDLTANRMAEWTADLKPEWPELLDRMSQAVR